ncbi:hypothetical protein BDQ17DRAFT_1257362 [Cyathus striatus]|nr:hypothetical protein BDQ17DRAFT_1257362 [Cyathus striatus]
MSDSPTPLDIFFTQYELEGKYRYNKNTPITKEFRKLRKAYHWKGRVLSRKRQQYREAIVDQFNSAYGTDVHDLNAWRHICQIIGISPVPETITDCKKAVKHVHINLVDLVDTKRTGSSIKRFNSEVALSNYTMSTEKIFPKLEARAGGILKFLLRNILNPSSKRGFNARGLVGST